MSIAILPSFQISGHQLFKAEVPGPVVERLEPRIRETAKKLWAIYAGLSVMETLLLWLFGMSLFDAVTHTFATMATGGFSTANRSIEAWSSPLIQFTITFFMLLAGANFALYFRALRGNFKSIKEDEEFKVYGAVILVGTALVWLNLMRDMGIAVFDGFRLALFQVTSIVTTTGFTTADFGHWPSFSRTILVALMFIGGCAGSTGGSIKVVRILTVAKHSFRELVRAVHPRRVDVVKLNGRPVPESVLASVLGFVFLYFVIFFAGVGIMSMLGLELVCSFTAVAATLGNVGPGLGIVSPSSNYASIPYVGKWVLIFLMVTGRLELYTVLALLIPGFWRRRHSSAARSPHANMHADRSS